ncbi:MAG: hypothetical protein NTY38_18990 [Acidobacteria bacterium]|nr:hypothetical protein [Acidobacteriota bacterium]
MPSSSATARTSIQGCVIAGDGLAQSHNGIPAVPGQFGRPGQIAAEGVNSHRVGAVQAPDEVGDRVRCVDEAAIHVIAGIEQHKHVGADEGVGSDLAVTSGNQRARRAVVHHLENRLVAFGERGDLLLDAVLEDLQVTRLQAVDIPALVVCDGKAVHYQFHLHPEDRPLAFLCVQLPGTNE